MNFWAEEDEKEDGWPGRAGYDADGHKRLGGKVRIMFKLEINEDKMRKITSTLRFERTPSEGVNEGALSPVDYTIRSLSIHDHEAYIYQPIIDYVLLMCMGILIYKRKWKIQFFVSV